MAGIRLFLLTLLIPASVTFASGTSITGAAGIAEDIGVTVFVNGIVGSNTRRKLSVDEFRGPIQDCDFRL